jgi:L,D-peptidoglycan transpeptidase YkuD (ErfK/YbiS/YcfS/YnhG family)
MRQISPISFALTAALAALLASQPVRAESCVPVLDRATRLVVVTVPNMDTTKAALRMFERTAAAARWTSRGTPIQAVVGARGIAWGHPFTSHAQRGEPIKQEGDQRTPAGIYNLGAAFGVAKSQRPNYLRLTPGANFCVEDARSKLYGRIVPRSTAGKKLSGADMAAIPNYRRGLVIDYPPDRATKAGSCIFVHIWSGESVGTAGCVALPETVVADLQEWIKGRHAAIAIVSEDIATRFGGCLPPSSRVSLGDVLGPPRAKLEH